MVRVPGLDPIAIKKALDIGASTVMVPQVGTEDEAKRAVEYAKYPPQGSRGITPTWTTFLDVSWDDYLPAANDETCVIVQIESPQGIANLDAIAAVEGVDVVFAGPADLSASLGVIGQLQHPKVQAVPGRVSRSASAPSASRRASPGWAWSPPRRRTTRGTGSSTSARWATSAPRGSRRRSQRCAHTNARADGPAATRWITHSPPAACAMARADWRAYRSPTVS